MKPSYTDWKEEATLKSPMHSSMFSTTLLSHMPAIPREATLEARYVPSTSSHPHTLQMVLLEINFILVSCKQTILAFQKRIRYFIRRRLLASFNPKTSQLMILGFIIYCCHPPFGLATAWTPLGFKYNFSKNECSRIQQALRNAGWKCYFDSIAWVLYESRDNIHLLGNHITISTKNKVTQSSIKQYKHCQRPSTKRYCHKIRGIIQRR